MAKAKTARIKNPQSQDITVNLGGDRGVVLVEPGGTLEADPDTIETLKAQPVWQTKAERKKAQEAAQEAAEAAAADQADEGAGDEPAAAEGAEGDAPAE